MRDGALEGERRGSTYRTVQGLQMGASSGRTSNYTRMSKETRDLFFIIKPEISHDLAMGLAWRHNIRQRVGLGACSAAHGSAWTRARLVQAAGMKRRRMPAGLVQGLHVTWIGHGALDECEQVLVRGSRSQHGADIRPGDRQGKRVVVPFMFSTHSVHDVWW
jgi:hypothetical protein